MCLEIPQHNNNSDFAVKVMPGQETTYHMYICMYVCHDSFVAYPSHEESMQSVILITYYLKISS